MKINERKYFGKPRSFNLYLLARNTPFSEREKNTNTMEEKKREKETLEKHAISLLLFGGTEERIYFIFLIHLDCGSDS